MPAFALTGVVLAAPVDGEVAHASINRVHVSTANIHEIFIAPLLVGPDAEAALH
jgi:hypothetical protein